MLFVQEAIPKSFLKNPRFVGGNVSKKQQFYITGVVENIFFNLRFLEKKIIFFFIATLDLEVF